MPAELPAYLAASLAETAADDLAQQYAGQAQDIPAGSPRGDLVATSPTLPTASTGTNSVIAFGAAELWTIDAGAPDGFEAGPTASNERLYLPDIHPAGSNGFWVVIEVAGVEIAEVFISQGGIQGATGADRRLIIPVSLTADALVRVGFWPRSGATASYIQITGNADTLAANTVVKVYTAVVRGAGGSGGAGGGVTIAQVLTQIMAGTNITVDRTTAGQITIASSGGGGGGLSIVSTDATLDGDGTTGDPLEVANPFTDADETKLDSIATGATAVTIAQVLTQIMAGTNITVDRTTAGQITIASSGGGGSSITSGQAAPSGGSSGDAYIQINPSSVITAIWENVSGTWTEYTLPAGGSGADLSDDTPEEVTGTVSSAGTSTEASRSDHEHNLVDGAVTQAKLSDGSVHTSKIADDAVTEAKIDAGAVTAAKIPNQEISHVKLGSSVGGVNQAAGRITEADGAGNVRWADKGGGSGSPLSDADPEDVGTTASPGTSTESSRADHVHIGGGTRRRRWR